MHALIAAGGSDWSFGGSMLTFAFPMILFITVGATLWVLYTMPHMVPGHRYESVARPLGRAPAAGQAEGTDGSPETGPGAQRGAPEG